MQLIAKPHHLQLSLGSQLCFGWWRMNTHIMLLHSEKSVLLLPPDTESWYLFQEHLVFLWLGTFSDLSALPQSCTQLPSKVAHVYAKHLSMTLFINRGFLSTEFKPKHRRDEIVRNTSSTSLLPVSQLPECHGKTRPDRLSRWAAELVHWGSTGGCWRLWHMLPAGTGWSQCTLNTFPCTW